MENRRFILIALLGVVLFFMYQAWQKDYPMLPPSAPNASTPAAETQNATTEEPTIAAPAPPANSVAPTVAAARNIHVVTDVYDMDISTAGGEIHRAELHGYPEFKHEPQNLALLDDRNGRWFVLQSGLAGAQATLASPQTSYTSERDDYRMADGADTLEVTLEHQDAAGFTVRKVYQFHRGRYEIGLTQTLANRSAAELVASPYVRFMRIPYAVGAQPRFSTTFMGIGSYQQKDAAGSNYRFRKISFDDLTKEPVELKQTGGWVSMLQHYFLAAIIPPADEKLTLSAKPAKDRGYLVQYVGAATTVPPQTQHDFVTRIYLGPQLQKTIGDVAPGLELTLDYGILTPLAKPLFWVLQLFYRLTHNYGFAIILLTLSVKLAMFKLSEAQFRSMAKMKKFAPRIAELKERYADDRERQQKAMMELYKKEGFNPLAGCWPLLVQMPVFFALYWVLLQSVELRQVPFALWIQDLSAPDPYFVLPVLYGISMWATQRLSGQTMADPMQQKMMNVMPIALTAFFTFFPSGLVLYWLASNLIGIAQQAFITHRLDKENLSRA